MRPPHCNAKCWNAGCSLLFSAHINGKCADGIRSFKRHEFKGRTGTTFNSAESNVLSEMLAGVVTGKDLRHLARQHAFTTLAKKIARIAAVIEENPKPNPRTTYIDAIRAELRHGAPAMSVAELGKRLGLKNTIVSGALQWMRTKGEVECVPYRRWARRSLGAHNVLRKAA